MKSKEVINNLEEINSFLLEFKEERKEKDEIKEKEKEDNQEKNDILYEEISLLNENITNYQEEIKTSNELILSSTSDNSFFIDYLEIQILFFGVVLGFLVAYIFLKGVFDHDY